MTAVTDCDECGTRVLGDVARSWVKLDKGTLTPGWPKHFCCEGCFFNWMAAASTMSTTHGS